MKRGVHCTDSSAGEKCSNQIANGSTTTIEAANWIMVPVRKSKWAQYCFWYSVPNVIDSSANTHKPMLAADKPPRLILLATTSATPARPSSKPSHCRRCTDSPTIRGRKRGQDRLQPDDQRRQAGRHAELDRAPDAGQIAGLHQHPGHRDMAHAANRPRRAQQQHQRQQDDQHADEAQQQKGQRRRIRQAVFGNDEAGAPDQHEHQRHGREPAPGTEILTQRRRMLQQQSCWQFARMEGFTRSGATRLVRSAIIKCDAVSGCTWAWKLIAVGKSE